nr:MFS transporter [uncultured Pseudomonas sp.]
MTHSISRIQLASLAACYCVAMIPFNLAPLIMGALIETIKVTETQAGLLVTAELLTMALVAMFATSWGHKASQRKVIFTAFIALAIAHFTSAYIVGFEVLLFLRLVAGLAAGVLLLAANTIIAASQDPVRTYGASNMLSTGVAVVLMLIMPYLVENYGLTGVFWPMGLIALVIIPLSKNMLGDINLSRLPEDEVVFSVPIMRAAVLIFLTFFMQVGQGAFFAFCEKMGVEIGHMSTTDMGLLLAVSYIGAVPASGLAAWQSNRFGSVLPLACGFLLFSICTLALGLSNSKVMFVIAFILYNFSYFYLIPYILGVPAFFDHTGRLVGLVVGTFLVGLASGPYLGSWLVSEFGYAALGLTTSAISISTLFGYVYLLAHHPSAKA